MDFVGAFDDLPQIPLQADGRIQDAYRWSERDAPWFGARTNQRAVNLFGSEVGLDAAQPQAMSNMQRYLSGPERPLFQTDIFQLDSRADQDSRRFDFDPQFEPQAPWPYPEKNPRQKSPDNYRSSWSVSSSSSYGYSQPDELSTGSSPREYGSQDTSYSGDYRPFPVFPMDDATAGAGGSCALREIQQYPYPSEEPEQPMDDEDLPEMKMEYASCEQETHLYHGKIGQDDRSYTHVHEEEVIRVRDAESVKPCLKTEDEADSDYNPNTAPKRRRRRSSQSSVSSKGSSRRSSNVRRSGAPYHSNNRSRVSKRTKSGTSPKNHDANPANRPFPCPFAGYSCNATFASKNEWKRHVSTQHIRLGFWRCELCPSTVDGGATTSYNDFNRKDLFAQHLRRMHMPSSNNKNGAPTRGKGEPITEDNMADFQQKCYKKLRDAPPKSSCLFCTRTFEGPNSWDERMEHVGRHFEKDKKTDTKRYGVERWIPDAALEKWLSREGLIEVDDSGAWQLGDGTRRRTEYDEIVVKTAGSDDDDDDVDDSDD